MVSSLLSVSLSSQAVQLTLLIAVLLFRKGKTPPRQPRSRQRRTHYAAQREYEAERQAVDEIMRKIDEEDAADAAKRAAQQAATRAYIADFLKQQVGSPACKR